MRPPDLPGGNIRAGHVGIDSARRGFNEAAGFTRRKRGARWKRSPSEARNRFNEAAGFTRRKLATEDPPPTVPAASMRPPDLPGGNRTLIRLV